MVGFMPRRRTARAAVASGLVGVLLAGTVIAPQAADAIGVPSAIDGTYQFNANGWTGTLSIIDAGSEAPSIVMAYDELGTSENLTGTWSTYGELTFNRVLSNGVTQIYDLYEGTHVAGSPVFGGFFFESDLPGERFGVYADDFVPRRLRPHAAEPGAATKTAGSVPSAVTAASAPAPATTAAPQDDPYPPDAWTYLDGMYAFNGNGWTGKMLIAEYGCPSGALVGLHLDYDDIGTWEGTPGAIYDPSANQVGFVRTLGNGVTQDYELWLGTHVSPAVLADGFHPLSVMFGGYFTESDTGGQRYAAFATYTPPGVGC